MEVLEQQIPNFPAISQETAIIYDPIVLIHNLLTVLTPFGNISSFIMKQITILEETIFFFFSFVTCTLKIPLKIRNVLKEERRFNKYQNNSS